MTSSLKHYTPVALLLAGLLVLSAVLTALFGTAGVAKEGITVLAVNYPTYLAAREVVGDAEGITVEMLAGNATGCLHDYQLSPADRLALERADVILTVGETPFLHGLTEPTRLVDLSDGLTPLCDDPHHAEEHEGHDHGEHINEHVWMSPWRYRALVHGVAETLAARDTANAALYFDNDNRYGAQIIQMRERLLAALGDLPSDQCVIFHESLAYLADDLGLRVALSVDVGQDSGIAAADLAAVARLVAEDPHTLLLYDSQYPVQYDGMAGQVLTIHTAVDGDRRGNDWLDAMEHNIMVFQQMRR